MLSNFVDQTESQNFNNVVKVATISILTVPLFFGQASLVKPVVTMTLGNLKPLVIATVEGRKYEDYEFL